MGIAQHAVGGVIVLHFNLLDALVGAHPLLRQGVQGAVRLIPLDDGTDLSRQRAVLGQAQAIAVRGQGLRENGQPRLPGHQQLRHGQVGHHSVNHAVLQGQQHGRDIVVILALHILHIGAHDLAVARAGHGCHLGAGEVLQRGKTRLTLRRRGGRHETHGQGQSAQKREGPFPCFPLHSLISPLSVSTSSIPSRPDARISSDCRQEIPQDVIKKSRSTFAATARPTASSGIPSWVSSTV